MDVKTLVKFKLLGDAHLTYDDGILHVFINQQFEDEFLDTGILLIPMPGVVLKTANGDTVFENYLDFDGKLFVKGPPGEKCEFTISCFFKDEFIEMVLLELE